MRPLPLMLFAAGFGTRMGALTQARPKPLIEVAGKPLVDHALGLAAAAGVESIAVNLHYRGEMLERHLAPTGVKLCWERERILETGGGLRAALPQLGTEPVLTLNSDAIFTGENPLAQLMAAWDPDRMDCLLLLLPKQMAIGHSGTGDFLMNGLARLTRAEGHPGLVYLGAQILRTDALSQIPDEVFSLNRVWDGMIARGRAFGLVHRGGWCDVGRPEGIAEAEALLARDHV